MSMQPYQKDFYHITLVLNGQNAGINYRRAAQHHSGKFPFFLSPEHIYSWTRDLNIDLTIFFKPSFLNFYTGSFWDGFFVFDLCRQQYYYAFAFCNQGCFGRFPKNCTKNTMPKCLQGANTANIGVGIVVQNQGNPGRIFGTGTNARQKQTLVFKFKNLVNNLFISYKQVGDYAKKMFTS